MFFARLILSMGVSSMGCQNPAIASRNIMARFVPFIFGKTPDCKVRRDANILNKHTVLWIVLNLLTTDCSVVFCN